MGPWRKVVLWFLAALFLATFSGAQGLRAGSALIQGQADMASVAWFALNAVVFAGATVVVLRILYRTARGGRGVEKELSHD